MLQRYADSPEPFFDGRAADPALAQADAVLDFWETNGPLQRNMLQFLVIDRLERVASRAASHNADATFACVRGAYEMQALVPTCTAAAKHLDATLIKLHTVCNHLQLRQLCAQILNDVRTANAATHMTPLELLSTEVQAGNAAEGSDGVLSAVYPAHDAPTGYTAGISFLLKFLQDPDVPDDVWQDFIGILGEHLMQGSLLSCSEPFVSEALIVLKDAYPLRNIDCLSKPWESLHQLCQIRHKAGLSEAGIKALQALSKQLLPDAVCQDIDDSTANALLSLHASPAKYLLFTRSGSPEDVQMAAYRDGESFAVESVAQVMQTWSCIAPQDKEREIGFETFFARLVGQAYTQLSVLQPALEPLPAAREAPIQPGVKRNKYTGAYRPSELVDENNQPVATLLKSFYHGGYGKVRMARLAQRLRENDNPDGHIVAKEMRTPVPGSDSDDDKRTKPSKLACIRQEIKLTSIFAPFLRFQYVYNVNGKVYALQRRMAGNLAQLVENVDASDRDAVVNSAARQTAYQLWKMIANDYLHQDFKPKNVLWDADGTVVTSDFGLAILAEDARTDAGTRGFIAPEIYRDLEFADKSDVWSWGVAMVASYCDPANPNPFEQNVRSKNDALQKVAEFSSWQKSHAASGKKLSDPSVAAEQPWGSLFARIHATNPHLANFLRHTLQEHSWQRADMRSVMLFTSALQPAGSAADHQARAAMRKAADALAVPAAEKALDGYEQARRSGLLG